jgi:hypothetical protein
MSNNAQEKKGCMQPLINFIMWMGVIIGFLSAILTAVSYVAPRAVEPIILTIYQIETPAPRIVEVTIEAPQVAEVTRQVEVEATRLVEVEVTRLVEVEATREIVVTATPPPPTAIPETTLPGTILEEGQWWYSQGKRFIVDLVELQGDDVTLRTRFENISANTVTFSVPDQDFVLTDNLGKRYIAGTVNCGPPTITLEPGQVETCAIFFRNIDLVSLDVTQLIFSASPSTFEEASWQIPVNH